MTEQKADAYIFAECDLPSMVKAVAGFAAPAKDGRIALQGVLFEHQDGYLRLVGCDGYALAVFDTYVKCEPFEAFLVSAAEAVAAYKGVKGPFFVLGAGADVKFGEVTVRKIDAAYPNYRPLMPSRERCEPQGANIAGNYMALLGKTAKIAVGDVVRYIGSTNQMAPQVYEIRTQDGVLTMAVMPVRIPF